MKILVTGAFGNVGTSVLAELLNQHHTVSTFDLKTPANLKKARTYNAQIECFWGDVRDKTVLQPAVVGQDVVIHLIALIPPLANQELAYSVNVGGTRNLLEALENQPHPPALIYTSSVAVYGNNKPSLMLLTALTPPHPEEPYAEHKIECEKLIRSSKLRWLILRLSAVEPLKLTLNTATLRLMFEASLDTPVEFVHTRDVGLAIANAVTCPQVWGKTLLIGGGPQCQIYLRDYIQDSLEALGIGHLPEAAFSREPFHTGWLDTQESQQLLQYQRYLQADYLQELAGSLGYRRRLLKTISPLARRWILRYSPYLKKAERPIARKLKKAS